MPQHSPDSKAEDKVAWGAGSAVTKLSAIVGCCNPRIPHRVLQAPTQQCCRAFTTRHCWTSVNAWCAMCRGRTEAAGVLCQFMAWQCTRGRQTRPLILLVQYICRIHTQLTGCAVSGPMFVITSRFLVVAAFSSISSLGCPASWRFVRLDSTLLHVFLDCCVLLHACRVLLTCRASAGAFGQAWCTVIVKCRVVVGG